jgi:hypothetical protein
MSDLGFVVAGYGVILGGIGLYAVLLLRRLRAARDASARTAGEAAKRPANQPPE